MKLKLRVLSAAISALMLSLPFQSLSVSYAEDSSTMNVTVDVSKGRKAISPYIYGVNDYGNTDVYENLKVNAVRQGGNRYTAYNWETNWSNAGSDWQQSSDTNIGDITNGAGYAARKFSSNIAEQTIPYKMTTLQMAGYVSADKNGTVAESEIAPSSRWKEVKFKKDGALSLEPDTTDDYVYMDEYVNYMVKTLGDADTATGMQGYSLDNEPALWNDTHPLMHPDEVTNHELIEKSTALAKVVKSIDPKAEVFGPAFWGMLPCIQAGETDKFTDPEWQAVKNNYKWYMDYYLEQMKKAGEEAGQRLLDVFDVHYYSQGINSDDDILQAARSLYDPEYKENSWLQPYNGQHFPFLTRMQESIKEHYDGTKLAVSEYNLGNIGNENNTGKLIHTGIAEMEALGAFALNDVYFATYWGTLPKCPYVASAINLYTNYDGKGASFGDTLVSAETEDLSKSAAFASIKGDDDSTVTLTLSNKQAVPEKATVTLDGTTKDYKSVVVYGIKQDQSDIKIWDIQNDLSGRTVTVELPALSAATVVISDKNTDTVIPTEPKITTKETKYNFTDLEKSANGYPMIPLGDKEHLKEIVIYANAYSNAGAAYGSGGGGLCFNKVVPEGTNEEKWASISFGYSLGENEIVVPFNGKFTVPISDTDSENVKGTTNDTYIEFQDWWKYSEKDPSGADITVNYNSVKLVYEYEEGQELPTDPKPAVKYDVNGDGEFTLADIVALQKWLTGADGAVISEASDADANGKVNVFDLVAIKRAYLR